MAINWEPTRSEEIRQNVETLLSTTPGTVPLARALGIDGLVDEPANDTVQRARIQIVRAVRAYETRAIPRQVIIGGDADGQGSIRPTVVIEEVPE